MGAGIPPDSWRQAVGNYAESTSAHGASRIYRSVGMRRIVWTGLFLFSLGFVISQVVVLMRKYFSFESETELRVSYNRNMSFPAITLCNLNPMRLSKIIDPRYLPRDVLTSIPGLIGMIVNTFKKRPWLLDSTGLRSATLADPFWHEMRKLWQASSNATSSSAKVGGSPDDIPENEEADLVDEAFGGGVRPTVEEDGRVAEILEALGIPLEDIGKLDPGYTTQALYAVLLSYVDEKTMAAVGHQPQDFIRSCAFDGIRCNYTDFIEFQTDSYGNCFTFNHGADTQPILYVTQSGPKHSLALELNVEQYEYVTDVFNTAGARLIVHNQGIRPFPQEEGVNVAPGYHTNIGVTRSGINRLPKPYGNCTHGRASQKLPGYKYSVMACLKLCLQSDVEAQCQCTVPMLPSSGIIQNVCSYKNGPEDYLCMLRAGVRSLADGTHCACPEACTEASFNMLLSFADWPNAVSDKTHLSSLVGESEILRAMPTNDPLTDISPYRNNLLKLNIYYQQLNDISIIQKANYGWANLLSDIGGQCGLWVGMSVLTMCEGLELLLDVVLVACNQSGRKRDACATQNVTPMADAKPSVYE